MTTRQTATLLRAWLNENKLTLSDLRKAQILLLNGKMGSDSPPSLSSNLKAIRPVQTVNFDECTT